MSSDINTESASALVARMRLSGIKIWADGARLCYLAPKGTLGPDDLSELHSLKLNVIELLTSTPNPTDFARERSGRFPLTYAQRWFLNALGPNDSQYRLLCVATRIVGAVDFGRLRASCFMLTRIHDSLRLQIPEFKESASQELMTPSDTELKFLDLSKHRSEERDGGVISFIQAQMLNRSESAVRSLFETFLIRLGQNEHVLAHVMNHLISDALSLRILKRDLWRLYSRYAGDAERIQASISTAFFDYSILQCNDRENWASTHGQYWERRLQSAKRLSIFQQARGVAIASRLAVAPIELNAELTGDLLRVSRLEKTTLTLTVLAAYVCFLSRWCATKDVILQFMTTGRDKKELGEVIGFFAAPLFLRIQLLEHDTFVDLIRKVKEEYTTAHLHSDSGRIAAQVPRPDFLRSPTFNWIPEGSIDSANPKLGSSSGANDLELTDFDVANPFDQIEWSDNTDNEPAIDFSMSEGGIAGHIVYPRSGTTASLVSQFASEFIILTRRLVEAPLALVRDIN